MSRSRRGFTLLEVSVGMCLLAGAIAAAAQLLAVCARQRQGADRQFAAQLEAGNIAERIGAMNFDEVSPATLQSFALSSAAQELLPDGAVAVTSTDTAGPRVQQKQIAIEVSWQSRDVGRRSIRLTTWKFAPGSPRP